MNSDHLNEEGARQFVNILMDEVVHYETEESLIRYHESRRRRKNV